MQKAFQNPFQILFTLQMLVGRHFNNVVDCQTDKIVPDVSEDDVVEVLGKEEAAVSKATGRAPLHSTMATFFLLMGLELEESQ